MGKKEEFLERIDSPTRYLEHVDSGLSEGHETPFLYMTCSSDTEFTVLVMKNIQCLALETIEAQHTGSSVESVVTKAYHRGARIPISVHYEEHDTMTVKVAAPENTFVQILERKLSCVSMVSQ